MHLTGCARVRFHGPPRTHDGISRGPLPSLSERRVVARALAGALLAGEWEPKSMAGRARRCVGERRRWPADLALIVWHGYATSPADRPGELARFIGACPPFVRALSGERPVRVVRWFVAESAMGDTPWPVPALPTVADLGRLLDLPIGQLLWFADVRSLERDAEHERLRHYRYRWLVKPTGGVRLLEAPKPRLRQYQRALLHRILDAIPAHPAAHGFRSGRSALSYASPHVGQEAVLRFDLEDFFGSVSASRVYATWRAAGYPEPVAHLLTGLVTNAAPGYVWRSAPRPRSAELLPAHHRLGRHLATPHLPQGAPTSPALANLAAHGLDRRLAGLAARLGFTYTRYADDLAFSGGTVLARLAAGLESTVSDVANEEGFRLNPWKTRLLVASGRQQLAGVVVNRRPNVARPDYDALKAILHNCARHGAQRQNRAGHPDFRAHVLGRVAWVASIHSERGTRLQAAFDEIDWDAAPPDLSRA